MRYLDSACKHGVVVEDIAHALRFPLRLINLDDSRTLTSALAALANSWR